MVRAKRALARSGDAPHGPEERVRSGRAMLTASSGRWSERRRTLAAWLVLLVITAGGAWARADDLGRRSYSYDEMFHVFAARSLLETGTPTLPSGQKYLRGLPYTRAVALGFEWIGESEGLARAPAALAGVLTIIAVYALGSVVFGRGAGLAAALLTAFSPDAVAMSRYARLYAPAQLLVVTGAVFYYVALEKPCGPGRRGWCVRTAATGGAAIAVLLAGSLQGEVFGVLLPLGLFTVLAFLLDVHHEGVRPATRSLPAGLLATAAVGAAAVALLAPAGALSVWERMMTRLPWFPDAAWTPLYYHAYLAESYGAIWLLAPAATLAVALDRPRPALYVALLFWVPFLFLSFVLATQSPRYIFLFLPFLFVVMGEGCRRAVVALSRHVANQASARLGGWRYAYPGVAIAVVVTLAFAVRGSTWFATAQANRLKAFGTYGGATYDLWREAAAYVRRSDQPSAPVIANADGAALHYLGRLDGRLLYVNQAPSAADMEVERTPTGWRYRSVMTGVPAFTDLSDLVAMMSRHDRGWVILDRRRADLVRDGLDVRVRAFLRRCLEEHQTEADASLVLLTWTAEDLRGACAQHAASGALGATDLPAARPRRQGSRRESHGLRPGAGPRESTEP